MSVTKRLTLGIAISFDSSEDVEYAGTGSGTLLGMKRPPQGEDGRDIEC